MEYETVIGLEVHAQLLTRSKMFCRCSADYASTPPNTHVCPVCLGMPGVLPVINRRAVEYTMMSALALNCPISENTRFDRKNYPYPDLVKGYQISQSGAPLTRSGHIAIEVDGATRSIGINHIHLEEDTSKLLHRTSPRARLQPVDVNRSGVPLMEIRQRAGYALAEEARQYLINARSILQYWASPPATWGRQLRCDANISIRPVGARNSARRWKSRTQQLQAVFQAMEYEAKRR
jgi:aspartyl-tRNA(Asn)/glutamyl-tRNA(Gln) amidotransferase subunit B